MTLSDGVSPSPHLQRRIREVQVFLEENLDRDVDLRTIAREASLSPYYVTRQFTAYVGVALAVALFHPDPTHRGQAAQVLDRLLTALQLRRPR